MFLKEVKVTKPDGILNKDAAQLVQRAMRFTGSEIYLEQKNKKINAKSIMGVISLGLKEGDTITISATGPDGVEAVGELAALLEG